MYNQKLLGIIAFHITLFVIILMFSGNYGFITYDSRYFINFNLPSYLQADIVIVVSYITYKLVITIVLSLLYKKFLINHGSFFTFLAFGLVLFALDYGLTIFFKIPFKEVELLTWISLFYINVIHAIAVCYSIYYTNVDYHNGSFASFKKSKE